MKPAGVIPLPAIVFLVDTLYKCICPPSKTSYNIEILKVKKTP